MHWESQVKLGENYRGLCRINPPVVNPADERQTAIWPCVYDVDSCGSWWNPKEALKENIEYCSCTGEESAGAYMNKTGIPRCVTCDKIIISGEYPKTIPKHECRCDPWHSASMVKGGPYVCDACRGLIPDKEQSSLKAAAVGPCLCEPCMAWSSKGPDEPEICDSCGGVVTVAFFRIKKGDTKE